MTKKPTYGAKVIAEIDRMIKNCNPVYNDIQAAELAAWEHARAICVTLLPTEREDMEELYIEGFIKCIEFYEKDQNISTDKKKFKSHFDANFTQSKTDNNE